MNIPSRIEFIQFHRPALPDGTYEITVTQTISTTDTRVPHTTYSVTRRFTVTDERHTLTPADILAVFPPVDSLGDHSNVLPHVILSRSTLPWERRADLGDENTPWLALLLFNETEDGPSSHVVTLGELMLPATGTVRWPGLTLEAGQQASDKVTVIDVPKRLLSKIMPAKSDLAYLAHVRQGTDEAGNLVGEQMAVIVGNRLPARGCVSAVHLVSLEGRYNNAGFDYQGAGDEDLIRLVSLQSWRFTSTDPEQTFSGLLTRLNHMPGTLRLPNIGHATADAYLAQGFVPLSHRGRQGDQTVSWYRGPLLPGTNETQETKLPNRIRAADELVRYHTAQGLFDVSYAAAWELGRLLALQSQMFAITLYRWKRAHVQQLREAERQLLHPRLPFSDAATTAVSIPSEITTWFERLSRLEGIPFNYIVPDERLLPVESIRFFSVDPLWIDCLLDGAFSIGRVTTVDYQADTEMAHVAANPHAILSGFLLRSNVVSGWPGLLVDGYGEIINDDSFEPTSSPLPLLRMERLSPTVLLCLFAGELQTVDIHQQPEMLHFGLNAPDATHPSFFKRLRDNQGQPSEMEIIPLPWHDETNGIVDMTGLARAIQARLQAATFTAAQFALEMVEGVEKVRFKKIA